MGPGRYRHGSGANGRAGGEAVSPHLKHQGRRRQLTAILAQVVAAGQFYVGANIGRHIQGVAPRHNCEPR